MLYSGSLNMYVSTSTNFTNGTDADQVGEYTKGWNEMVVLTQSIEDDDNYRLLYGRHPLINYWMLKVVAMEDTNYTITVLQDYEKLHLNWGRPYKTMLEPQQTQTYTIRSTTTQTN